MVKLLRYINPLTLFAIYWVYVVIHMPLEAELINEILMLVLIMVGTSPAIVINVILNKKIKSLPYRLAINAVATVILAVLFMRYS